MLGDATHHSVALGCFQLHKENLRVSPVAFGCLCVPSGASACLRYLQWPSAKHFSIALYHVIRIMSSIKACYSETFLLKVDLKALNAIKEARDEVRRLGKQDFN